MMSGNFYSVKKILRRRIWTLAMCALFFFCYYVIGTAFTVISIRSYGASYGNTAAEIREQLMTELSTLLGVRMDFGWVFVILIGIILVLQCFYWMDNRQMVDFYESQPEKRSARFRRIYLGGIFIYAVTSLTGVLAAILIAAGAGAMTPVIAADAVYEYVRLFILFLGVYSVSVLAAQLTGNLIVAILADFVLLFYEMFAAGTLYSLKETFFRTFASGKTNATVFFSPIYIYGMITGNDGIYYSTISGPGENYGLMTASYLKQCFDYAAKWDLYSLGLFAATTALAYLAYSRRRSEDAGTAVVFAWVRGTAKIAVAVLCSLEAGLIAWSSCASDSHASLVVTVTVMLFTSILVSAVMQIIYEADFAAVLHGAWMMAVAGGIAILIFGGFRHDVFGYDRFVPEESEVESAALLTGQGEGTNYLADGTVIYDPDRYAAGHMKLTNIGDVLKLADYGMEYTVNETTDSTYTLTILYRMKNGRSVYRSICVPYTVDASLLDRIMESEEYKAASFSCFTNAAYAETAEENGLICYNTGWKNQSTDASDVGGLLKVLQQDVRENYNYSLARAQQPIGEIEVRIPTAAGDYSCNEIDMMVYPSYSGTIEWLTQQEIYSDGMPAAENVSAVTVINSHSEYWDDPDHSENDYDLYDPTVRYEYTDKDKISQILDVSWNSQFTTIWQPVDDDYFNYNLEIRLNNGETVYAIFRSGQVPQFVKDDTAVY